MSSSSTQQPTPERQGAASRAPRRPAGFITDDSGRRWHHRQLERRRRTEHPRVDTVRMVLVWLALIVLAVAPFPWWW